jgi:hypothetical protein
VFDFPRIKATTPRKNATNILKNIAKNTNNIPIANPAHSGQSTQTQGQSMMWQSLRVMKTIANKPAKLIPDFDLTIT